MNTYRQVLITAKDILKKHDIADADVDAWYLLAHVFHLSRAEYFLDENNMVPEDGIDRYMNLVKKRASNIPLQYIIGSQEFMGLEFEVNESVLIPRQDTEILVEEIIKVCKNKSVLDMCTGSGCIIISLAKLGDITEAVGVDISEEALNVAKRNAKNMNVKVNYIQSNLFRDVEGVYDIIVSNPPYIPTDEIENLMPEVKEHEPILALDGSQDGLNFYRQIAECSPNFLKKNGYLFLEIGHDQGVAVKELLHAQGFYDIEIKKDLSGLDRVVIGRRR